MHAITPSVPAAEGPQVFETVDGHKPPSSVAPAARKMLLSFVYLAIYTALSGVFPKELIWSSAFATYPMYKKCAARTAACGASCSSGVAQQRGQVHAHCGRHAHRVANAGYRCWPMPGLEQG